MSLGRRDAGGLLPNRAQLPMGRWPAGLQAGDLEWPGRLPGDLPLSKGLVLRTFKMLC